MYPYKIEKDTAAAKDGYFSLCPEKDVYFYNAPRFPGKAAGEKAGRTHSLAMPTRRIRYNTQLIQLDTTINRFHMEAYAVPEANLNEYCNDSEAPIDGTGQTV